MQVWGRVGEGLIEGTTGCVARNVNKAGGVSKFMYMTTGVCPGCLQEEVIIGCWSDEIGSSGFVYDLQPPLPMPQLVCGRSPASATLSLSLNGVFPACSHCCSRVCVCVLPWTMPLSSCCFEMTQLREQSSFLIGNHISSPVFLLLGSCNSLPSSSLLWVSHSA